MKREEVNSCTYPVDDLLTTNYIFEPIRFLYIYWRIPLCISVTVSIKLVKVPHYGVLFTTDRLAIPLLATFCHVLSILL